MPERIVGHLDMDAFFASVEERDRPYLKGKPIVIGADPKGGKGRGVVSTASYAARVYGVGSAMPITRAWRACKEGESKGGEACVFITGGFRKYGVASREVFSIVSRSVEVVDKVSVDEAYMDLSFLKTFEKAAVFAKKLKEDIHKETGLTASIGIGPNKLIAKIASDHQKPDGLTVIRESEVEKFLDPLSLRAIPGIGKKAMEKLSKRRLYTVQDAKKLSWQDMDFLFGKWGFGIYERLRGIDERGVLSEEAVRKSIGHHHTFSEDTLDMEEIFEVLRDQAKDIIEQMKKKNFKTFRTVVLTMRFADFETRTRSLTAPDPTSSVEVLELRAIKLALPFFDATENPQKIPFRLVGLRVEKLTS